MTDDTEAARVLLDIPKGKAPSGFAHVRHVDLLVDRLAAALAAARAEGARAAQWHPFPEEQPPIPQPAGQVARYLVTTVSGRVTGAEWTHTGMWVEANWGHPTVVAWMPFPAAAIRAGETGEGRHG